MFVLVLEIAIEIFRDIARFFNYKHELTLACFGYESDEKIILRKLSQRAHLRKEQRNYYGL